MTTVPARSLSGDHLGRRIQFANDRSGTLDALSHDEGETRVTYLTTNGAGYVRYLAPDTPVTIEDTE